MSFKWQTHKAGSLSSSISNEPGVAGGLILTRQQRHRIAMEFKDTDRSHSKISFVTHRFNSFLLNLVADQGLFGTGHLVQNALPQLVAGMSTNLQLARVFPVAAIPNNTDHLPLNLSPGHPLRPTDPASTRLIIQRVTRDPALHANNIDVLFRYFRTHCLCNNQGVQQIDMADVWTNPRGRSWSQYCNMQNKEVATNQTTFFQKQISIAIKKVLRFLLAQHTMALQQAGLNQNARKALLARTAAFLNPKHIFHFAWNAQHPLFAAGVVMNAAAVAIWVNALAPFYPLLRYILDDNNPVVNGPTGIAAAAPAGAFPNSQSIYRDCRGKGFHDICTGANGRRLGERALLFLRFAGRVLGPNIMHANDDEERQGPAAAKPVLLCPLPSKHTVKFLYYDYRMLLELIVRPSWQPWRKRQHTSPGIPPACFHIPDPLNNNAVVLPVIPPQGPVEVAMRNLCAVMFSNVMGPPPAVPFVHPNGQPARPPFRQRNRFYDQHQWKQYGYVPPGEQLAPHQQRTLPIDKMGIVSDGASLHIAFTTKVVPTGPNDAVQARYSNRRIIPRPEDRKYISKHKNLPAPATPHPGTKKVGYVTTSSALYVMNDNVFINPYTLAPVKVLSTDFGQIIHSYTTDIDIPQLIRATVQAEQAGDPIPAGYPSHRAHMVAMIKKHSTIITGRHTSKQTLRRSHEQSLVQLKRNNHAQAVAGNVAHLSIQSREDQLRDHRHALQGATIATLCNFHRREFYHFTALTKFYNHSYIAGRQRLSREIATDSRNMRAAHQMNGYQHPIEVNRGQTLLGGVKLTLKINKNHHQRRAERFRAKQIADQLAVNGHWSRLNRNNPPLHYVDTSQGNKWARGSEGQSNKTMANCLAESGAGVIEQTSRNTSKINPLRHEHMADRPGEIVPPLPAGGYPHERLVRLQQMQFACPRAVFPNHVNTHQKRVRRGGPNGDRRKRRYDVAMPNAAFPANGGLIPLFDPLNPIPHAVPQAQNTWKNMFRLEASINPSPFSTAGGQPIQMQPCFLPGHLRLRLTAAQQQAGVQAYAIMPHDLVGTSNIRQAGLQTLAHNRGPNWNGTHLFTANPGRVDNWHNMTVTSDWAPANLREYI